MQYASPLDDGSCRTITVWHAELILLKVNASRCCAVLRHLVVSNSLQPHELSLPSASVQGIFQARILEWVAISDSKESSQPRDQICITCIGRWILYHCITWEAQQGSPGSYSIPFLLPTSYASVTIKILILRDIRGTASLCNSH